MRTRVKICGITRPEDAVAAAALGADAIGLVFYRKSPRHVSIERAREICAALPPFVTVTGLFVDESHDVLRSVLDAVPLDLVQLHGGESPEYCDAVGRRWMKAITMEPDVDIARLVKGYANATGLLFDAWHPQVPGGSGQVFDWERIPQGLGKPVVLAGGLNPDNVADAVRQVRPYAVDVSSGVEREKGVKDYARIEAFIRGVRSVNDEC